jgi:hypothetical protein
MRKRGRATVLDGVGKQRQANRLPSLPGRVQHTLPAVALFSTDWISCR